MFQEMLREIEREVSPGRAFQELKEVHNFDRWFTSSAFARSAAYAVRKWKEYGLSSAKVDRYPADGKTPVAAWIMPYAWDVEDATLVIEEPAELAGTVIADYREAPCSLAMWSGPTPDEGLVADLVRIEDASVEKAYRRKDVKGKIVFTSSRPVFAKGLAAAHGAVGVLSDFVTHPLEKPDEAFWMNAWSDDPGGWGLNRRDSRIFGFDISPRKGRWLESLMEKHRRVRVRARVKTTLHEGEMFTATAVIPGETRKEEVLVLGHGFEQGANDNASGVAVMLEAARVLSKLIAEGRLPRPRRSIRFLMVSECYTTLAYCERYPDRMANTVAALCCDSVAHKQGVSRAALALCRPPDSNASFVTAFAERLAEATFSWRPEYKWAPSAYLTTDNVVGDPMIGPPTMLLTPYRSDLYWHSTGDTLDKIDVDALGRICVYVACYLYEIASAAAVDALYFAALATSRAKCEVSRAMSAILEKCREGDIDFWKASRRLLYTAERGVREVHSVRALLGLKETKSIEGELSAMSGEILEDTRRDVEQLEAVLKQCGKWTEPPAAKPAEEEVRAKARGLVPVRKYIGTMTYDFVPPKDREGFQDPRWDSEITAALFWCDGKRTLEEVLALAGNELGCDLFHLVPVFEFMAGQGLLKLRRA